MSQHYDVRAVPGHPIITKFFKAVADPQTRDTALERAKLPDGVDHGSYDITHPYENALVHLANLIRSGSLNVTCAGISNMDTAQQIYAFDARTLYEEDIITLMELTQPLGYPDEQPALLGAAVKGKDWDAIKVIRGGEEKQKQLTFENLDL